MALLMYIDDSGREKFPPQWNNSTIPVQYPFQITLCDYLDRPHNLNEKQADIFRDPAAYDPIYQETFGDPENTSFWTSYGCNPKLGSVQMQDIRTPSQIIVFGCTMTSYTNTTNPDYIRKPRDLNLWGPHWTTNPFSQSILADWHNGDANILFADFSVSRHSSEQQYQGGYLYNGWWPKKTPHPLIHPAPSPLLKLDFLMYQKLVFTIILLITLAFTLNVRADSSDYDLARDGIIDLEDLKLFSQKLANRKHTRPTSTA